MKQLNSAVEIQEALFDVPHEKLKSLQEQKEVLTRLNVPESTNQKLQEKIQQCENEMAQAKKSDNMRLEQILDIANRNAP